MLSPRQRPCPSQDWDSAVGALIQLPLHALCYQDKRVLWLASVPRVYGLSTPMGPCTRVNAL